MKGSELARRLGDPTSMYAHQLMEGRGPAGFYRFFQALRAILEDEAGEYLNREVPFADVRNIMGRVYSSGEMDVWLPVIQQALEELGRYDHTDEWPWNSNLGSCSECLRYQDGSTSDRQPTRVCPQDGCGRRWHNDSYGPWRQVVDPAEWDAIRHDLIRAELQGGPTPDNTDPEEPMHEVVLPHRILWPFEFQKFDHGGEIEQQVPVSWCLKAGDVIPWSLAQFAGTTKVVKCGEPDGDTVTCTFVKVS